MHSASDLLHPHCLTFRYLHSLESINALLHSALTISFSNSKASPQMRCLHSLTCIHGHSSTLPRPAAASCSDTNIYTLSAMYCFTPPLCCNLLQPPAPKIPHLCSLVHTGSLLHSGQTWSEMYTPPTLCNRLAYSSTLLRPAVPSCSENDQCPLSFSSMCTLPLCSDLLHPPAPSITHPHSLVHPHALLHSAPTCFTLLL
jgi:hypothetical protein